MLTRLPTDSRSAIAADLGRWLARRCVCSSGVRAFAGRGERKARKRRISMLRARRRREVSSAFAGVRITRAGRTRRISSMWWDTRTKKLAGLVSPRSRVLEFGAGRATPALPACRLHVLSQRSRRSRGPDTIVCDLNRRPLPGPSAPRRRRRCVRRRPGVRAWTFPPLASGWPPRRRWPSLHTTTSRRLVRTPPGIARMFQTNYFGYMNHYTCNRIATALRRRGISLCRV